MLSNRHTVSVKPVVAGAATNMTIYTSRRAIAFALPVLQDRLSPVRATLLLGAVWTLWHLPLLWASATFAQSDLAGGMLAFVLVVTLASIVALAFWYTWLWNRTGSILVCVALHASYNAANGAFVLMLQIEPADPGYAVPLVVMTAVLLASIVALSPATRGRLGMPVLQGMRSDRGGIAMTGCGTTGGGTRCCS